MSVFVTKDDKRTCNLVVLTVHCHDYLLLRHKLSILNEFRAFASNPLCSRNCFKKCIYCFENVEDDLRDVPRLQRKTVKKKGPSCLLLNKCDKQTEGYFVFCVIWRDILFFVLVVNI